MGELSVFADESGDRCGHSKYYLLTLVFHDQDKGYISKSVSNSPHFSLLT